MSKLAIISNGPSADLFDKADRGEYSAIIGVNGQVARWRCDWWVFCDWDAFAKHLPLGWPILFLPKRVIADMETMGTNHVPRLEGHIKLLHEDISTPPMPPDRPQWNLYSGVAAIGLAWHLKPDVVDAFGADMSGNPGVGQVGNRWEWERPIWDAFVTAMQADGIAVRRILP